MTFRQAILKRNIELFLMYPFVAIGKFYGILFPGKHRTNYFLFFPSADIGGSVKVNADILQCILDKKPIIIFSKKPKNNGFLPLFQQEGVQVLDLHKLLDNKLFHFVNFFYRGVISSWINKAENPVVFGGEGLFFYKVIPHIKKSAKKVELCHLNTWFNFSQAFIKYIDYRIFSTPKIKRDAEEQYRKNDIPQKYLAYLYFFDNKINIPPYQSSNNETLQVLFVGRGAPQKRVHLIAAVAKRLYLKKENVHFSFVGHVRNVVPEETEDYCTFYGNIDNEKKLSGIYSQSDVLILTSAYEGLPLAIMEMMARGKVVLSTAVDGIPDYIIHQQNGLLLFETDEEKIIDEAENQILNLLKNSQLKKEIGLKAYDYAVKHFGGEAFCTFYKKMLTPKTGY